MRAPRAECFALALAAWVVLAGGCGRIAVQDGPPPDGAHAGVGGDAVPRAEPPSRYGNPASYEVDGRTYHTLRSARGYVARGIASWYGSKFHGRRTSSGEPYDMYRMTAAHRTLPLPTYVEVVNLRNGRRVVVRVNDRGPFHEDRLIDLSWAAAKKLGFAEQGTAPVEVRALEPGGDDEAAPAQAAAPGRTQPAGALFVQVGAFREPANAERLRARLAALFGARVQVRAGQGDGILRVHVGPLPGEEALARALARLRGLGLSGRVLVEAGLP